MPKLLGRALRVLEILRDNIIIVCAVAVLWLGLYLIALGVGYAMGVVRFN